MRSPRRPACRSSCSHDRSRTRRASSRRTRSPTSTSSWRGTSSCGASPSEAASPRRIQDAVMRLGALNGGAFFQAQPDTAGKLAAFAFAFEHLEIAGYELLKNVARRAGDNETVELAGRILEQERAAAAKLAAAFDRAAAASLEAQGAAA